MLLSVVVESVPAERSMVSTCINGATAILGVDEARHELGHRSREASRPRASSIDPTRRMSHVKQLWVDEGSTTLSGRQQRDRPVLLRIYVALDHSRWRGRSDFLRPRPDRGDSRYGDESDASRASAGAEEFTRISDVSTIAQRLGGVLEPLRCRGDLVHILRRRPPVRVTVQSARLDQRSPAAVTSFHSNE